jgi:hypothetical protein
MEGRNGAREDIVLTPENDDHAAKNVAAKTTARLISG